MSRKFTLSFLILLFAASCALGADVALTSVGQSPDAMMVRVVLRNALKVNPDYNALMTPSELGDAKVLVAVVGGSSKGLGAAGINPEDEVARAKSLLQAAKDTGKKILVMHVGGEGRRGTLSDLFITEASPYADGMIIVDGGNQDGIFTKIAEGSGAPVKTAPNVKGTGAPLKEFLADWGVM
ncbi:MAG: hypothetical protein IJR85_10660 [Synergistaceae bacterium]|nr:hypothetical protein [Synergistaceae bacterium]